MCIRLDGTYTGMLKAVLGFTWRNRITNDDLYGELSKITAVLPGKRLRSIGHMWRRKEEVVFLSTTDAGTKTGNKEKRKTNN